MDFLKPFKKLFGFGQKADRPIRKYVNRPTQGIPSEYERWDEEDPTGIDSRWKNPQNELYDFLTLYQIHPWVYSAASAIATAVAGVPYRIKDKKGEAVKDSNLVRVFARPNPHEVWYEFSELGRIYLECSGNMFIEEVRNASGGLEAMYLLRPDKVRILTNPKVKIAGYIYEPYPGREILYSPSEVTHIKYASSIDEYWGICPAYAAQNSIILDMYSTTYNKKFFTNSAVPEGVLQTEGSLSDQTFQRLKRDWSKRHQGINRAFEVAILEEGLEYKAIGFNQRDMMMVETKELSREDVLSCYRVPPAIIGLLKGAQLGSLREQKKMFYTDTIFPKCEKFEQIINEHLMPEGTEFEYVLDEVSALIEDVSVATQVAMSLVSHGIMSINEVRKRYFAMKDVEWGEDPWMPVGLQQWDPNAPPPGQASVVPGTPGMNQQAIQSHTQDSQQARNQSTPMGGSLPRSGQKPTVTKANAFEKMIVPEPLWENARSVRDWQVWSLWKGLATPDYMDLKRFFKNYFAQQFAEIAPRVRAGYKPADVKKSGISMVSKMLTEVYQDPYEEVEKARYDSSIDPLLIEITSEGKKLAAKLLPKAKSIVTKHAKNTLGQIGVSVSFNPGDVKVEEFLKKFAGDQAEWITKSTRKLMKRELSKATKNGEDLEEVMQRLNNLFKGDLSEHRLRQIARTELVTLTQQARYQAAVQSGVVKKKRWVCSLIPGPDGSRDPHVDIHDVEADLMQKFAVENRAGGHDYMDGPGDPSASPENVVGCLCVLDFDGTTPELETLEGDVIDERKRDTGGDDMGVTVNLNVNKLIRGNPLDMSPVAKAIDRLSEIVEKDRVLPETNVVVNVPKQLAPRIIIKNKSPKVVIPEIKMPEIRMPEIKMPEIKMPVEKREIPVVVHISPKLEATLKMPKRKKRTIVERDERTGRATGTTETEETVE
jgi:HK97 family phage portal protein